MNEEDMGALAALADRVAALARSLETESQGRRLDFHREADDRARLARRVRVLEDHLRKVEERQVSFEARALRWLDRIEERLSGIERGRA